MRKIMYNVIDLSIDVLRLYLKANIQIETQKSIEQILSKVNTSGFDSLSVEEKMELLGIEDRNLLKELEKAEDSINNMETEDFIVRSDEVGEFIKDLEDSKNKKKRSKSNLNKENQLKKIVMEWKKKDKSIIEGRGISRRFRFHLDKVGYHYRMDDFKKGEKVWFFYKNHIKSGEIVEKKEKNIKLKNIKGINRGAIIHHKRIFKEREEVVCKKRIKEILNKMN